jgi:phosphoribosylanthranilate isomerase
VRVTRAKICGITRPEDAEFAAAHGAWAIGMVRWPRSPRACDAGTAAEIVGALRRRVACVGVFVNATLDELAAEAEGIGFTHLQLHGDEGPAFCTEAARRTGCKIIKAAQVATAGDIRALEAFRTDFHMLDAAAGAQRGGSGRTWEWGLLTERRSRVPLILSGGLSPDNVAEAIAVARPYAVDTASGTEAAPGIKDPDKVLRFLEIAAADGARGEAGDEPLGEAVA